MENAYHRIDRDLRTRGRLFRILNKTFTVRRLNLFGKFKIKLPIIDQKITFSDTYIPRNDGSKLRIGIFKSKKPTDNATGVL